MLTKLFLKTALIKSAGNLIGKCVLAANSNTEITRILNKKHYRHIKRGDLQRKLSNYCNSVAIKIYLQPQDNALELLYKNQRSSNIHCDDLKKLKHKHPQKVINGF